MEVYTSANLTIEYLLKFLFNKLSTNEMDNFELFLQSNGFYAEIVNDLIYYVNENDFDYEESKVALNKSSINLNKFKTNLKLSQLVNKFENLKTLSLSAVEEKIKQWFSPKPPYEYKVALMSSEFKVKAPTDKQNYTTEIEFKLNEPVAINDKLLLSLFESGKEAAKVEVELEEKSTGTKINIEDNNLHPGVYYWRIQALQTGSKAEGEFFINKEFSPFN